jgi:hypothetical protein
MWLGALMRLTFQLNFTMESFIVDASVLSQPAGKPHHLETRLKARKRVNSVEEGIAKREEFINARKQKLAMRIEHVNSIVEAHSKKRKDYFQMKREKIAESLCSANEIRLSQLDAKVKLSSEAVAHAKQVAKMNALKRIQKIEELNAAIEKRHSLTTMRRNRLLTIPRSKILDHDIWAEEESEMVNEDAATTIQKWWRKSKMNPIIKLYSKFNFSQDKIAAMGFNKYAKMMQNDVVLRTMNLFFLRARRLQKTGIKWDKPARVFLTCYMITCFPEETLKGNGVQDEDLKTQAQGLIQVFDSWLATPSSAALGREFLNVFSSYYDAFEAWKSFDTNKLIEELITHFLELENLWLTVMNQEDADQEWSNPIQQQQSAILKRLSKLGLVAIDKLNAARTIVKQQLLDSEASVEIYDTEQLSPMVYRPTKISDSVLKEPVEHAQNSVEFSATNLQQFGSFLSNEQLAHELVMNPNYKLEPPVKSEFEQKVAEIAKKALTDVIREEIQKGEYSNHVLRVLKSLKQVFLC